MGVMRRHMDNALFNRILQAIKIKMSNKNVLSRSLSRSDSVKEKRYQ